jgi:hypothetical protein
MTFLPVLKTGQIVVSRRQPEKLDFIINFLSPSGNMLTASWNLYDIIVCLPNKEGKKNQLSSNCPDLHLKGIFPHLCGDRRCTDKFIFVGFFSLLPKYVSKEDTNNPFLTLSEEKAKVYCNFIASHVSNGNVTSNDIFIYVFHGVGI